ncbi:inner nuclear membrane protein enriched at telomere/subtelomere region [Saxophila tyrrhenica]|uniref:Inner nuclear membrane protein enriched at telomere/subtelomere region n=1 Tax=Saxophila tyrrhenica TaxID=1690608 RepID=A0AAV9P8R4_9PEZI|nr:inner nuclear membrane protein enriched at telomere/subtelomere region [Saxophila tyrrhenica]
MEEQAYLEPGFDPATLTVPQLRSVLVAQSINYPSSAKKSQLIDLFNEHVAPQAKQLRNASLRVKRSSRGILDVASQSTDNNEDELPPAPSTGRRSGGRTTRARTEEAEEVPPPTTRSTRHSTAPPEATPRRASSKHARTIDRTVPEEEPGPKRPTSRRSRPSAQTPRVKEEEARDEGSPFSMENVFQSGSSPPPPTTDRRRTTMNAPQDTDRRRSDKVRRRTHDVKPARQQADGTVVPTRRTFEMPVSAMRKERVEPTEEFTPEEEQDLALAQQSGELVQVRPKSTAPAAKAARNGFSAIFVAVLAASAYLYGDEKFKVGYCGRGEPSREIAGVQVPEWADAYRPSCEPCPQHAICYDNLKTACEPGFVLTPHPLSMIGLIPIPPTCQPDTAMTKKVNSVKERVVEELREQNARYECGDAPTPEVKETVLKRGMSEKRRKGMSNQEWEELWDSAIGEVRNVDEVTQGTDG